MTPDEAMRMIKAHPNNPLSSNTGKVLVAEIERLRWGKFNEEEFQNLCHNLSSDDAKRFCDGCDMYQRKLLGKCRTDELQLEIERLREENQKLKLSLVSDMADLKRRVHALEQVNQLIHAAESRKGSK